MKSPRWLNVLCLVVFLMPGCSSKPLAQQSPKRANPATQQTVSKPFGKAAFPNRTLPNPAGKNFKVAAVYVKAADDNFDLGDCRTAGWDTSSAAPDWAGQLLISTPFNPATVRADTAAKPASLTTFFYLMSDGRLWLYGDEVTYTGPPITIASERGKPEQFREYNRSILQWFINNGDLTSLDNDGNGEADLILLVNRVRAKQGYSGIANNFMRAGTITGSPGEPVIRGSGDFRNSGVYGNAIFNLDDARVLCAHEIGHHLFRGFHLNGLHRWNLMSGEGKDGPRNSGVTMSAYEKHRLGWLSYKDITETTFNVSLGNLTQSNTAVRIPIPGSNHYFILENRQYSRPFEPDSTSPDFCSGTSLTIPGTGLLISYYDGVQATILAADGVVAAVDGKKNGDASDLFPNGSITEITPYTNPSTNTSSGVNTRIAIKNIRYAGRDIVFDVYHNYRE